MSEIANPDKPNHQFTTYIKGAKAQIGLDINYVMANILLTNRKSTNIQKDFIRLRSGREESDFAEWELWAYDTTARMQRSIETNCYIKNDKACWNCPYKVLCGAANEGAQKILAERMFKDNGRH